MKKRGNPPIPVEAVVAAGLLIFVTIVGVAVHQSHKNDNPASVAETAAIARTCDLRFVDAGDGASVYGGHVSVYDATTGAELAPLRENEGFVRAVLNSLTFERTKAEIDAAPVFRLTAWSDNRLTLEDPATGKRISLGAFGEKNKAAFLRFFAGAGARS